MRAFGIKIRHYAVSAVVLACLGAPLAVAAPKGEITIATSILLQRFDPTALTQVAESMTYDFLYDGLINLGADGLKPALATSWTLTPDGKQIDFTLRQGIKFHNGDAFTAEDVKYTFDLIKRPDSPHVYAKTYRDAVDRIEIVSPYHVRFVMKEAWPSFFTTSRYAMQAIVPKSYHEKVGAQGFQEKPVGTGPFKIASMKPGEWTRYEANLAYWDRVASVQFVVQQLVKEPFTRFAMLQKGEADIAMSLTGPLITRVAADPKYRIFRSKYSGTSGLFFHRKDFPQSQDKNVRMAIAHAIDREGIAKTILGGICQPAPQIFTPATFGYLEGLKNIPYDPQKAKSILAAAGGPAPQEVTFLLITEAPGSLPGAPQVMEAIATTVEGLGYKVKRVPVEMGAYVATFRQKQEPNIFSGLVSIPDDGGQIISDWYTTWAVWAHGNAARPEYEKIYEQQRHTIDTATRLKLLQDFARLEDQERETIPLFWCDTPFAAGPRIKDWKPSIGSPYQLKMNTIELAN